MCDENKAKVMILGTYHFQHHPGHVVYYDLKNISKVQKEIEELNEALIKFKPNKIAVEYHRKNQDELTADYKQYCSKNTTKYISSEQEIVQIAFNIGKQLNLNNIYATNVAHSMPLEDAIKYAKANNKDFYNNFIKYSNTNKTEMNDIMNNGTMLDVFKHLNSKESVNTNHNMYLDFCKIGAGDNYCGVNAIADWYKRNLLIFGNILDLAEPNDRVLVIYGADHTKILQNLVNDSNTLELVDTMDYLK